MCSPEPMSNAARPTVLRFLRSAAGAVDTSAVLGCWDDQFLLDTSTYLLITDEEINSVEAFSGNPVAVSARARARRGWFSTDPPSGSPLIPERPPLRPPPPR